MVAISRWLSIGMAALLLVAVAPAQARLAYTTQASEGGDRFLIVSGAFEFNDNLSGFRAVVSKEQPVFVVFDSPGGNVVKAIELGRLVRALGLSTVQVRTSECASACSLAFLGGVSRAAQPGSIGVHKSSFSDTSGLRTHDAVSAVQQLTADVIGYMMEMGVDPALLQLSLSYDSDDIRYLSGSEMTKFRVTTVGSPPTMAIKPGSVSTVKTTPPSGGIQAKTEVSLDIPVARTGAVRHPKGAAPIKLLGSSDAESIGDAANGSPVEILSISGDWYRVSVSGQHGYMHYSWIRVDQFEEKPGDHRFVQVKSFSSLPEAEAFVRKSSVPLTAHLAANGWFAVTLRDHYLEQEAKDVSNALKAKALIASDSMVTIGNTYVRKVCCD